MPKGWETLPTYLDPNYLNVIAYWFGLTLNVAPNIQVQFVDNTVIASSDALNMCKLRYILLMVLWLREETHNQKVVSSNPGAGYWMAIFHNNLL